LSPGMAPAHSDTPSTIIITTESDPHRDDGERYAERLRQAGVPVWGHRYEDMSYLEASDGGKSAGGSRVLKGVVSAMSFAAADQDNYRPPSSSRQT
jgi:acetyl esterase/lipase